MQAQQLKGKIIKKKKWQEGNGANDCERVCEDKHKGW